MPLTLARQELAERREPSGSPWKDRRANAQCHLHSHDRS